jgi:hypothetical protein
VTETSINYFFLYKIPTEEMNNFYLVNIHLQITQTEIKNEGQNQSSSKQYILVDTNILKAILYSEAKDKPANTDIAKYWRCENFRITLNKNSPPTIIIQNKCNLERKFFFSVNLESMQI